jgi:hypothetical protein
MARHNRDGQGVDQCGHGYTVSFQPDWLRLVKVTRNLESGRQSTKTLFRNPSHGPESEPGERIRTRIFSPDQDLDVEVTLNDPRRAVKRIRVTCVRPGPGGQDEEVEFTLENNVTRGR